MGTCEVDCPWRAIATNSWGVDQMLPHGWVTLWIRYRAKTYNTWTVRFHKNSVHVFVQCCMYGYCRELPLTGKKLLRTAKWGDRSGLQVVDSIKFVFIPDINVVDVLQVFDDWVTNHTRASYNFYPLRKWVIHHQIFHFIYNRSIIGCGKKRRG